MFEKLKALARDASSELIKKFLVWVGALVGLWMLGIIQKALHWRAFDAPLRQNPYLIGILTYSAIVVTVTLLVWNWQIPVRIPLRALRSQSGARFWIRILFALLIPVPFVAAIAVLTSPGQIQDPSMAKLFPQTDELGPVFIRTFATNGSATFQFYDDAPTYGPNGYVDVQLRAFGSTVDYNSGWVIFFLRGVDFSDKKQLRFFIRGASGAEQIGLKAKDVLGREVAILLSKGSYLKEGKITTDWQEASIPLSHFGDVNTQVMDSFTFFTDGSIALTAPQHIYLGGFRLLNSE